MDRLRSSANSEPALNIVEGTASVRFRLSHFSLFVTKFAGKWASAVLAQTSEAKPLQKKQVGWAGSPAHAVHLFNSAWASELPILRFILLVKDHSR
jgi:hypothetical protein